MLLHLGRAPAVIVSSAEMAREIKKTHDVAFANRPYSVASEMLFYGRSNMAFAPYGEYWRQVRKICNLELLSLKRVQIFKYVREEEMAIVIKSVKEASLKKVPMNLTENLLGLTNNIVSRCALGKKSQGEGSNKKLGVLSRQFIQMLEAFSFQDHLPILGFLDHFTGLFRKMKRISGEFDVFLEQT
ncbi:cytochrome P450, partial [Ralstonia pseudosolanacearum]|uniref:cytochrome P450 n=1 Tax=Ralstonia pseudosolanacearum TaxID=1310165 RepID=UPI003D1743EB